MRILIELRKPMYDELVDAAKRSAKRDEESPRPEVYAAELIESALAERRLERIAFVSRRTPLMFAKRVVDPLMRVQS